MLGRFIQCREDSLTASVFSHLLHLPIERFWKILRGACYTTQLPETVGEPYLVALWPRWDAAGTSNEREVIPDLFMRFADFDLIVEAKRWDDRMQSQAQWQEQWIAYTNEYGGEMRPAFYIAVGGLHRTSSETLRHEQWKCPVIMCRWRRLLEQCKRMRQELARLEYPSAQSQANIRILDDTIDLFGWHGFSTGRWFGDFDFARHRLALPTLKHHDFFRSCSRQLRPISSQ